MVDIGGEVWIWGNNGENKFWCIVIEKFVVGLE